MAYVLAQNQADSHQSVAACIMCVWSFTNRDTTKFTYKGDYSPALKVSNPIVIVSDILSMKVSSSKDNYMSVAEAALSSGDLNYSAIIAPGDHVMIWMVNNVPDFKRISAAALANTTANDFKSGLKFVGRINSIRENLTTIGDGKKAFRYNVTMKSFSEFGSYVFYSPLLANVTGNGAADIARVLSDMSDQWSNIFEQAATGSDNISSIASMFIKIFLGSGPGNDFKAVDGQVRSPNSGFLIPAPLLKTLGLPTARQEDAAGNKYSDMLHTMIGLQKYQKAAANAPPYKQFIPSNYTDSTNNQILLTDPVPGTYISPPQNFNNVTVWSLLQAHMNPTLNEMYCTLRTSTKNGRIMPTLILRQIPFSKDPNKLDPNGSGNFKNYTPYLSLPRWKLDKTYPLVAYNLGMSDAPRFNFFLCKPANLEREGQPVADKANQYNNNNLYVDALDIARNGLRTHFAMSTADVSKDGSALTDVVNWKNLVADFYLNGQYKQNGSVVTALIQEPIAIGDNFEFDGRVFHIESVDHQYNVDAKGNKSFTTALGLSHGIKTDGSLIVEDVHLRARLKGDHLPGYTDEEIYANEKMIASSAEGRSSGIDPLAPADQTDIITGPASELTEKIDSLKKKMGIS